MRNLDFGKPPTYYQSVRKEILPLLPPGRLKILELGCGEGATLAWLQSIGRCAECVGIELSEAAARKAGEVADRVIVADFERDEPAFENASFDCILCLDVLEHLRDPWGALRTLAEWLRPGGTLVISVPNVGHISIILDLLLHGRFEYQDSGILDRTHLRFFTRSSAEALVRSAGLVIEQVRPVPVQVEGLSGVLNALTFGFFRDTLSWQFLVAGVKNSSH